MAGDQDNNPRQTDVEDERNPNQDSHRQPESVTAPHHTGGGQDDITNDRVAQRTPEESHAPTTEQRNESRNLTNQRTDVGQENVSSEAPRSADGTPAEAGSVVNATPLALTPGPRRRELGISPIRLTPLTNSGTPRTPTGSLRRSPLTPMNGAQESLVLWGTAVNMDDAEARLTKFIKGFQILSNKQPSSSGDRLDNEADNDTEAQEAGVNDSDEIQADTEIRHEAEPYYMDQLKTMSETGDSIMNVDMSHIHEYDPGLYRKVRAYPNELITVFDAVTTSIFKQMFPDEAQAITESKRKPLQVRTFNLLPNHVQSMRELNPSDISTLVAVRGMIIRASPIIPDIQIAMYSCSKCRAMRDVSISHGRIDEPRNCSSCNSKDSFTLIHSRSTFSDKQMVRLQEAPESIPKGETPSTFTLVMYDSLVDVVKPGDRVEITGILRANPIRVNPRLRVVRSVFKTYIDCVDVRVLNNNHSRPAKSETLDHSSRDGQPSPALGEELDQAKSNTTGNHQNNRLELFQTLSCHPKLYELLASSLAPSIFGMDDEKKGILLQLFGGADKGRDSHQEDAISKGSKSFRSSINILLVGDPGTSKSQLLHCAHRLSSRGVYTSGRGSSAVGLTAYVTRDPETDDYVLESGALVLSDRGLCCIDEFDKMSDFARSVLHEAMEQQTVSVAKAGIIATLNARTSVLAAANPLNSRYDTSRTVVDNIDLPPTLLSRFDLIYLVVDAPCADSDRKLAKHIVSLFFKNYDELKDTQEGQGKTNSVRDGASVDSQIFGDILDARTLTDYIAYARQEFNPKLSDEAAEALVNAYVEMRSKGRGTENISATPRQLESLIRLSEAHARMQLKKEVDVTDVSEAIRLVQSALRMAAYDPITGKIDMNLFSSGKGRESNDRWEALAQTVTDALTTFDSGQEVATEEMMNTVRNTSETDFTASDFRETLQRLEQRGTLVRTKGGKSIRIL